MNIPGFTAEVSIYKSSGRYIRRTVSSPGHFLVSPALASETIFGVVIDLICYAGCYTGCRAVGKDHGYCVDACRDWCRRDDLGDGGAA